MTALQLGLHGAAELAELVQERAELRMLFRPGFQGPEELRLTMNASFVRQLLRPELSESTPATHRS